jgi:hypothetical protein
MKVVCIRLASGEEVISRIVETASTLLTGNSSNRFEGNGPWEPTGSVTIEHVRGITAQQIGKNEMGIAFFPWSLGNTNGQFTINLDNSAVAIYPAEIDLEQGYLEQTSKIQIARGNLGIKM